MDEGSICRRFGLWSCDGGGIRCEADSRFPSEWCRLGEGLAESWTVDLSSREGFVEAMPLSLEKGREGKLGQGLCLIFCEQGIGGVHEGIACSGESGVNLVSEVCQRLEIGCRIHRVCSLW